MSLETLQTIWYLLIGALFTGYAILDGFDLGVGVIAPFVAKNDEERHLLRNAIGPFWDGNEVWLLVGGGALFAAFPHVYATVFSGFYLALMLVLFALIIRAVSFEFRHQVASATWQRFWDGAFFVGSLLPALLMGVAVGNVMRGVPIDAQMEYAGTFVTLLNPFALLVGLAGLAMVVMQGSAYLLAKTEGPVAERAGKTAAIGWTALVILAAAAAIFSAIFDVPDRFDNYVAAPIVWAIPALVVVFLALTRISLAQGKAGRTFLFSSLSIAGLMGIFGAANYPFMLPARNAIENSLTIANASASQTTLMTMLIIALIGMPLVIAYTVYVYVLFRGKVRTGEGGY